MIPASLIGSLGVDTFFDWSVHTVCFGEEIRLSDDQKLFVPFGGERD